MRTPPSNSARGASLPLYAVALGALGLAGCMSPAERRHVNLQQDTGTCASFGTRPGSRAYADCMLTQQRRRDVREIESLEKARLTSQLAKDGQIMAERARRQRCARDPDRRECGR